MRHRVYGKHLGRTKNQRTTLFKGLVRSLILHESIQTTAAKSKAIKGLIDQLINKSKEGTNASQRFVQEILPDKNLAKKLKEEIVPRMQDRVSGFTEVVRLGVRSGDGAMMVRMSLIKNDNQTEAKKQDKAEKIVKSKVEVKPAKSEKAKNKNLEKKKA